MTIPLVILAASVLGNSYAQKVSVSGRGILYVILISYALFSFQPIGSCSANCFLPPTPNWDACQFCGYACQECLCSNITFDVTTTGCYRTCLDIWFQNLQLLNAGLQFDPVPTAWQCINPNGNETKICEYACSCSSTNASDVSSCIPRCLQCNLGWTYATSCSQQLGGGK